MTKGKSFWVNWTKGGKNSTRKPFIPYMVDMTHLKLSMRKRLRLRLKGKIKIELNPIKGRKSLGY